MIKSRLKQKWFDLKERFKRAVPVLYLLERVYHILLSICCQIQEQTTIMATINERLDAIETKLQKAKDEIQTEIAALRDAINNGGNIEASVSRLETLAQGLDDIIPDAPPVDEDDTETDEDDV